MVKSSCCPRRGPRVQFPAATYRVLQPTVSLFFFDLHREQIHMVHIHRIHTWYTVQAHTQGVHASGTHTWYIHLAHTHCLHTWYTYISTGKQIQKETHLKKIQNNWESIKAETALLFWVATKH